MQSRPDAEPTSLFDVFVLARELQSLLAETMRDGPMSAGDYAFCSAIEASPGITGTELSTVMAMPLTTISDWLASAVSGGWVDVTPGARDRRRREARVTDAGARVIAAARDRFGVAFLAFDRHSEVDDAARRDALRGMIVAARAARDELHVDGA